MGILIACKRRNGRSDLLEMKRICANTLASQDVNDAVLPSRLFLRCAFLHHALEPHTENESLNLSHPALVARILQDFLPTVGCYVNYPTKTLS